MAMNIVEQKNVCGENRVQDHVDQKIAMVLI